MHSKRAWESEGLVPLLFERVVVAGVGLIGGSFALAARRAGLIGQVVGLGRQQANLELARERGIIDSYTLDPVAAVRGADLVFLAAPVRALGPLVQACAPGLAAGAVVTDAGSVKESVVAAVEAVLPPGVAFVGGHPIAGSEQAGAVHADADLFRGQRCVLTPSARSDRGALNRIGALWRGVGMEVTEMDARRHDAILARISHVPHVVAYALAKAVGDADPEALLYAGGGFRDSTRIAASPADVWQDIFLANRDSVRCALGEVMRACASFERALEANDAAALGTLIEAARAYKLGAGGGSAKS